MEIRPGKNKIRYQEVGKTGSKLASWSLHDCFASSTDCAVIFLQMTCILFTIHNMSEATQILNLLHFYYVRRIFL
jgi:hypothetical protein